MVFRRSREHSQSRFVTWLFQYDLALFLSAATLLVTGLMCLYSIDRPILTGGQQVTHSHYFASQLTKLAMGIVPFLIMLLVRPLAWQKFMPVLYVFNLVMLAAVLKIGHTGGGAQRWLQIGPIDFQPSELSKLLLVLTLSTFYASRIQEIRRLRTFLFGFVHVAIPAVLIYKQPHLGATIVVLCIWLTVSMVAGVPMKFVGAAVLLGLVGFAAAVSIPGVLDDYQLKRIRGLIHPDVKGSGYHTRQAEIAIGSGGLTGTGYLRGPQKAGNYVPEQQTDFIFTVVGEEGGLVGCTLVLGVFLFFFMRLWWILYQSRSEYHKMLIGGVLAIFVAHTFANLGMILRMLPVVGLWLPFMSYGGTALWLCMACVGLALAIRYREAQSQAFTSRMTL